jgi:hypothetical protein
MNECARAQLTAQAFMLLGGLRGVSQCDFYPSQRARLDEQSNDIVSGPAPFAIDLDRRRYETYRRPRASKTFFSTSGRKWLGTDSVNSCESCSGVCVSG